VSLATPAHPGWHVLMGVGVLALPPTPRPWQMLAVEVIAAVTLIEVATVCSASASFLIFRSSCPADYAAP
jgi:hypothetical protein